MRTEPIPHDTYCAIYTYISCIVLLTDRWPCCKQLCRSDQRGNSKDIVQDLWGPANNFVVATICRWGLAQYKHHKITIQPLIDNTYTVVWRERVQIIHVMNLHTTLHNATVSWGETGTDLSTSLLNAGRLFLMLIIILWGLSKKPFITSIAFRDLATAQEIELHISRFQSHYCIESRKSYLEQFTAVHPISLVPYTNIDRYVLPRYFVKMSNDSMGPDWLVPWPLLLVTLSSFLFDDINFPWSRRMHEYAALRPWIIRLNGSRRADRYCDKCQHYIISRF